MGQTPITGDADVFFMQLESSFDMVTNSPATISFVAGDAIRLTAFDSEPVQDWHEINEFNGSPSLEGLVEGKRHGTWSGTASIRTNAAGTASPMAPIWQAGLGGTVVNSPGVSNTYNMVATTPKSIMVLKHNSRESRTELLTGGWVAKLALVVEGEGNMPSCNFEGGFSSISFLYGNPVTLSGSGTSVTVAVADRQKLSPVGLKLKFNAIDNGGAGYTCTAYVASTGVMTITPALGAPLSGAEVIAAVVATPSFDGTIRGGTACGFTIEDLGGGNPVNLGFISSTITVDTGVGPLLKEATTAKVSGLELVAGRRVNGEVQFYFKDENASYLGDAWNGTAKQITLRAGPTTAGEHIKYVSRKGQMKVSKVDAPKSDVAVWTSQFTAMRYSSSNDEFYIIED